MHKEANRALPHADLGQFAQVKEKETDHSCQLVHLNFACGMYPGRASAGQRSSQATSDGKACIGIGLDAEQPDLVRCRVTKKEEGRGSVQNANDMREAETDGRNYMRLARLAEKEGHFALKMKMEEYFFLGQIVNASPCFSTPHDMHATRTGAVR